jgi:DNA-binding NarL/FixJ family response regulator
VSKKLHVLVVDDSVTIISRMKQILSEIDCVHTITTAYNTVEAEKVVQENNLHIILLDINMPGKNGVEYLKELKQKVPHIKVMMVTNQSIDYYRPICLGLGADYFIDKSNEFEKIPDIIEAVCNNMVA